MVALTNNWGVSQLCCSAGQSGFLAFWGLSLGLGAQRRREARQIAAVGRQLAAAGKTVTVERRGPGGAGQGGARWSVTYDVALPV